MRSLSFASLPIVPLSLIALLGGCAEGQLSRAFGLTKDAPDEFTVATRAPLSMPPDFTLRPPQPGALRPEELPDRTAAESALVPRAVLGGIPAGVSPGQAAFVRDAGGGAPADIRQRIDQEAQAGASDDGFVDKLLYWRVPYTDKAVVDPEMEAKRLRQNAALGQAPVVGDTPIIREKKTGWFHSLFSWL